MLTETYYSFSQAETGKCVLVKQFCRHGGGAWESAERLEKGLNLPLTKAFWVDASKTRGTLCHTNDAAWPGGCFAVRHPEGQ